jgi:hypothetical protein
MIVGLYPPMFHYLREYGMYVFRVFKDFEWLYVIMDDRLPGYSDNEQLFFATCPNGYEFWVPMLEKVMAKLFGNYQKLESG